MNKKYQIIIGIKINLNFLFVCFLLLRHSLKFHQPSTTVNLPNFSMEQRGLLPRTNKLVTSSSFNRTASKKRREFSKDKRHAASNVGLPYLIKTDEYQFPLPIIHQVESSSSLYIKYFLY